MSEWDCKHGVSDDAQTPCPLCSRDRRIAELEDECGKLRSLLRDDRDCWARNNELEARNAKLEAALKDLRNDRIAELEDERDIYKRTLDKRDTQIKHLQDRFLHFTERVNEERDGYARAYEQDKARIAELEAESEEQKRDIRYLTTKRVELEAALRQCRDIATLRNSPLVVVTDVCETVNKALEKSNE